MPRRVLFLAWAPFFSGAERALLLTLRSLDPARYEPVVIAGIDGEFAAGVRSLGIPCRVAPLRQADRYHPLAFAQSVGAVLGTAVQTRASIIHANDIQSFQPGGYVARLLRVPSVTHVRFADTRQGYEWFLRPNFSLAFFVSHDQLTCGLAEAPGVFGNRATCLYDCVQRQDEWSREDISRCRQELGLPDGETIVAITGQVAEVKGIWDFVEAARLLSVGGSGPLFVVLGDDLKTAGKTREAMERRVAELGLGARFRFLGFRPDAPRIVQAFDIVAVPSHLEPLGLAALEAMAAGRPVVGSRVGGIQETVVDGETGCLVPPATPRALADAIGKLLNDQELRARMSGAARRRVRDAFSIETHGRTLQARYDRLCASGVVHAEAESELA